MYDNAGFSGAGRRRAAPLGFTRRTLLSEDSGLNEEFFAKACISPSEIDCKRWGAWREGRRGSDSELIPSPPMQMEASTRSFGVPDVNVGYVSDSGGGRRNFGSKSESTDEPKLRRLSPQEGPTELLAADEGRPLG